MCTGVKVVKVTDQSVTEDKIRNNVQSCNVNLQPKEALCAVQECSQ